MEKVRIGGTGIIGERIGGLGAVADSPLKPKSGLSGPPARGVATTRGETCGPAYGNEATTTEKDYAIITAEDGAVVCHPEHGRCSQCPCDRTFCNISVSAGIKGVMILM